MQYTLRNVPAELDAVLRRRAREQNRSLNAVAVQALARGVGHSADRVRYRDLTDVAGTWVEDPDIEQALADQDVVDDDLWK